MITKTQVKNKVSKKTDSGLIETINLANKSNNLTLAKKLLFPSRKRIKINLQELNKIDEKNILVPGKVLSEGEINKKISISALSFSLQAKEKLKKAGCEIKTIKEELIKNPELKGVKII